MGVDVDAEGAAGSGLGGEAVAVPPVVGALVAPARREATAEAIVGGGPGGGLAVVNGNELVAAVVFVADATRRGPALGDVVAVVVAEAFESGVLEAIASLDADEG